ncbi:MAG TPA: murein biosynthesis integral membrane protein MurJ, partial [Vicinamibacterales bacterium]|nr:murein biosynthesis integral membrane protein MurJ [Vicinamibacterales bacterium]
HAGLRKSMPAMMVAAGMVLSRFAGFIRTYFFTRYLGTSTIEAEAFNQAARIPNFLQNLLGEGVLSASLIPVYSGMLVRQQQEEADRVARAVLGMLVLITSIVVLISVVFTEQLMPFFAWGFVGEERALTLHLVRIIFPGIALLVFSAWCLAILNSHHRFFLAYVAPVLWNAGLLGALLFGPHNDPRTLVTWVAWGFVIGSALQFGVQVPALWRIMAPTWTRRRHEINEHVREIVSSSIPVFFSRGVVQVSAYIDSQIATKLPFLGAVSALTYAQQLFQLPVGLFGMAVSSAALPSMSAAVSNDLPDLLRERLLGSQRAIAVLVIPSMIGFLAFGDVMVALLYQHGKTTHQDTLLIWATLAGSSVGLLSTTIARLYSAAFYAIKDTRTPMRFAVIRVAIVSVLGYLLAIVIPPLLRLTPEQHRYATAGLTVSAGLAGWVEFALLRRALQQRLGAVGIPLSFLFKTWLVAVIAALPATALRWALPAHLVLIRGLVILNAYGWVYLALAHVSGLLGFGEVIRLLTRGRRRKST